MGETGTYERLNTTAEQPARVGAVAVLSASGPAVAVLVGDLVVLLTPDDAARWATQMLREAGRADGCVAMASAMQARRLADTTREAVLLAALHKGTPAQAGRA